MKEKYNRREFLGYAGIGSILASGLLISGCKEEEPELKEEAQKALLEKNKAVCRRYYEEVGNKGNVDLIDEIFSTDYVEPQSPNWTHEAHKQFITRMHTTFPDAKMTIVEMIAEGDMVAIAYILTGTHLGEYLGVPPTGNKINIRGMHIFRVVDGKIVHGLYNFDTLGIRTQIGYKLVPPEKQGKK